MTVLLHLLYTANNSQVLHPFYESCVDCNHVELEKCICNDLWNKNDI